jgi:hypothetical protein
MKQSIRFIRGLFWSVTLGTAFLLTGCGSSSSSSDTTAPTATITDPIVNPAAEATGIPLDTTFEIVFDTVMDPASIDEDTIYLVAKNADDSVSAVAVTVDTVLNEADQVVGAVLTPVEPLIPDQVYELVVTTGVTDLLGDSPVSAVTSTFTVSDVASMVVPVVWPVADTVLSTEAAQTLLASLSSMMGVVGDGLTLLPADLTTLLNADLTLNDLLAAVQAVNPAADTVEALLETPLSVDALLGVIGATLPVGSEALTLLEGVIAQLPAEVTGLSISLGDILTLPSELLPLDPLDTSVTDALAVVTNPLALLESVAQVADAGGQVDLLGVGDIIANVLGAGGLVLDGGVLSQVPGTGTLTALLPTDLDTLVETILATDDPTAVVTSLLDGLDAGLLTDLLGGLLGGVDLVTSLTTLLGDASLAETLGGILDNLPATIGPDDLTAMLGDLQGLLALPAL